MGSSHVPGPTPQERDPTPYRFGFQLACGTSFVGSTPERLYQRRGGDIASEAVAGTRPRGPVGDEHRDSQLAYEMLMCSKVSAKALL